MAGAEKISIGKYGLVLLVCLYILNGTALAQCTIPVRQYVTSQQINEGAHTSVTNGANAADGNLANFSTLNRNFGLFGTGDVVQFLKFPGMVAPGKAVTIKASIPPSLLALFSHIEVQAFTNLNDPGGGNWQADAAGVPLSSTTLLNVLGGSGEFEVSFVPKDAGGTAVQYEGVWVKLSGTITLGESLNIYEAYYNYDAPANVGCSTPVDVLAGVRAGTVLGGILNASGSVIGKRNAIDNDPGLTTFAEMKVGAQLLSQVYHTTIFNSQSQVGDKIQIVLQDPGGDVLTLGALNKFSVQLYNGSSPVGTPLLSGSSFLSLTLLSNATNDKKYTLTITPTGIFDRVDIQMGGVLDLSLTSSLRIYDVKKIIATPNVKIDGVDATLTTLCAGNTSTLAVSNTQLCTTYKWYNAATGGTLLATGSSYTPTAASLATGNNIFYLEASRDGCTEVSTRIADTISINPLPGITPGTNPIVCFGSIAATLPYTAAVNNPGTYSIVWDAPAITAGFTNVTNAALPANSIPITIPVGAPAATYTGNLFVKNTTTTCTSPAIPFSVKVDAKPTQPTISLTTP